jgi:hypothetical protein
MTIFRRISKLLAAPMAAVMFLVSVPIGTASAGLIPTDRVVERGAVEADRARIADFLARDDVRAQLIGLGVDPAMAVSRAAGLSDTEIRDIAGRLDQLPAGQDFLGAVLGTALIIFLILLITDILGLTDVYPFVRR